jgi:DNA polymerase IV (archaeal DinB-like DNA polymerase)
MEGRVILHVDMDAFYAAVEARDSPTLRGRPLVIGADPKGGRGRGVVCTASYEARKYGIRSAMPISQAYRAAPHAVFLRPDFKKYVAESRKVMDILARYADALEVVGLDEAYLDVTERVGGDWDLALSLALSLQAAVRRELALSCSVGIAPSKSVAKVASDAKKPHGAFRLRPHEVTAYLHPLPTGKLHGCGPKTSEALRARGIHTVGQLARADPENLTDLGSHGAWLQDLANGFDPRAVDPDRGERKSRGNESTFERDESDPIRVREVAAQLLQELLDGRDRRAFATLTVKIRYRDFTTYTRSLTLDHPILPLDSKAHEAAHGVLANLLTPLLGRAVRLVGVRLSGFQEGAQRILPAYGVPWSSAPRIPSATHTTHGLQWTRLSAFA